MRTRPSPAHVGHGCGMTVPMPWQVGQGRAETTWPRKVRCTVCTSPRPAQVSQVVGWVPGAVPAPVQVGAEDGGVDGDRRLDAEDGLVAGRARAGGSRRRPAGCAGAGPRVAAPPKNASMMSWKPTNGPGAAGAAGRRRRAPSGSPPRSTICRFCGSDSTS